MMLKKNSQSYSESPGEHMFPIRSSENKTVEELRHIIKKSLVNNSTEKASEILAHKITNFLERQNVKSRKRHATILGLSAILALALGVSWLLEYPFNQNIWGYRTMIIGIVVEIILLIVGLILSWPKGVCYRKKEQEGAFEAMFRMLREFVGRFSEMTVIHLLMSIMSILILGGIFAQFSLEHRLVEFFKSGSTAFVCYDSANDSGGLVKEETVAEEGRQLLGDVDAVQIEQLSKNTLVTKWEAEREMRLSSDDWSLAFFHGEYSIQGLENQRQIDRIVLSVVEKLESHDLENVFDKPFGQGGAPQNVMDKISNASDAEEHAESFVEISGILDLREEVNTVYPKKSLTQLVANGYEELAYLVYINNGNRTTIIYYYGQSIINNLKCLEFAENTDKTIKERLTVIARLYRDIAYVCPDSEEAGISLKLAEAFEHAANQY